MMDEDLDSKYIPAYSRERIFPAKKKRPLTLGPEQVYAIVLKVEEKLNNAQIARVLAADERYPTVTPMTVGRWWSKPHVKRELMRAKERYNEELMPAIALELNEVRQLGVKEMKSRITADSSRLSEITSATKFASEEYDKHIKEIIVTDDNEKAKENLDKVWDVLKPEERAEIARRLAFGKEDGTPREGLPEETGS